MLDTAINGGLVCDARQKKLLRVNLGLQDGRVALWSREPLEARQQLDAAGQVVSPGFVDVHGHVDGHLYSGKLAAMQGITTTVGGNCGLSPQEFGAFLEEQERLGFPIHQAELVGHSFTLRQAAGITDPYARATPDQLRQMEELAEEAMAQGAWGVSLGLDYSPGASLAEVEAMARVNVRHGRRMPVHTRLFTQADLYSLYELLAVAKSTGVGLLISHFVYQYSGFGALGAALEVVERAMARGLDIRVDSGMYTDWATFISTATFDEDTIHDNGLVFGDMLVATGEHTGEHLDRELYYQLRESSPDASLICFTGEPWEVSAVLEKEYAMPSTDMGAYAPGQGHPQIAGSFPRYLRKLVREQRVLSLEEALYKATLLPAETIGLPCKGSLEPGYDGDVVVFDPDTICDTAKFPDRGRPDSPPLGISTVLVDGVAVVKAGQYQDTRSGRVLRYAPNCE